ncbi:MAG: GWxTD domain-containing protein [Luteibaculum sp.]
MRFLLSSFLLLLTLGIFAQPVSYYMSARYEDPMGKPYLDLIFDINGKSLKSIRPESDTLNQYQCLIRIEITDELDSLVASSETSVESPAFDPDWQEHPFSYLSRLQVPSGILRVKINMVDLGKNDSLNTTNFTERVVVDDKKNFAVHLSDMLFIGDVLPGNNNSPFYRNGNILVPYLNDYFPTDLNKLLFYTEIYNSQQQFPGGQFAYAYQILHPETKDVIKESQKLKRAKTSAVVPVLGSFDLKEIASGKYILRFEVRNTLNETVVYQEKAFYRQNSDYQPSLLELEEISLQNSFIGSVKDDSTLNYYLSCLQPIASRNENIFLSDPEKMLPDTEQKQRYFLNFWLQRNSTQPSLAWYQYKKEVDVVDKLFSTSIKRGYESDRGRVYLKYGQPNSRMERPSEPVSFPYEIWHYDQIESFLNVRFVFYNPNIATNDYQLLHSDMRGELRNPNWQRELQRRTNPNNDPNNTAPARNYGNNAKDFFDDPR